MNISEQLLMILGMALVTYIPRVAPLMLLSSRELNPRFMRWLEMVPPAVLAALLAQEIFLTSVPVGSPDGSAEMQKALFLSLDNVFLLASVPALLVGWLSRSFFAVVVSGMVAVALLRFWG